MDQKRKRENPEEIIDNLLKVGSLYTICKDPNECTNYLAGNSTSPIEKVGTFSEKTGNGYKFNINNRTKTYTLNQLIDHDDNPLVVQLTSLPRINSNLINAYLHRISTSSSNQPRLAKIPMKPKFLNLPKSFHRGGGGGKSKSRKYKKSKKSKTKMRKY